MSWPIEFDLEARLEFDQAADWYEQQKSGLGVQFVEEVTKALALVVQSPTMFAQVAHGLRQVCVRRFPFSVIYRQESSRILVLAVFHSSRDPETWKSRE